MQYKVTYPDGSEQAIEAETVETMGKAVVFLSENRTALLRADGRCVITDADGNEVTPTVGA